jgi:peptidoglycan hydrolase-like protein with peptidoglycan-binding domain
MRRASVEREAENDAFDNELEMGPEGPADTQFTSEGPLPPVGDGKNYRHASSASELAFGTAQAGYEPATAPAASAHDEKHYGKGTDTKGASHRFGGDQTLEEIAAGTRKVKKGDRGTAVVKLQQGLIDLGYAVPFGVDGIFGNGTQGALEKFQNDHGLAATLAFDSDTIKKLHELYDTRKPYIDNAKHDPADPGTRKLTPNQKKAALNAMVPPKGAGGAPAKFTEEVGGEKYGDRVRNALTQIIGALHKDLFEDKEPLRADEKKNFHDWTTLEGPGKAAKEVTDGVYETNYGGAAAFPAMTHKGGNLVDQWEDELQRNKALDKDQKKAKARGKVWYLINSNMPKTNKEHGAVPSGAKEKQILKPIVESFIDSEKKVQTMLDLDIGWEGAQLDGIVYLQRYKSQNPDAKAAKDENRVQMWELFHTCIHEYLHTLAHPTYMAWARTLDATRENTLVEGFCDFFTLNVRTTVDPKAVQNTVEGPYATGDAPPTVKSGVYPSHRDAERVVSIVGIKNAQAAYFRGDTKSIGKS